MIRLVATSIRDRWASFVGPIVAVALAVAILTACGVLLESGLRTTVPPDRYRGAAVVVSGRQTGFSDDEPAPERVRLNERLVEQLQRVPGVRTAVADDAMTVGVVGADPSRGAVTGPDGGPTWGHPWSASSLTPFRLVQGRAPAAADEVALDSTTARRADVAVGQVVTIESPALPRPYRVAGVIHPARGGPLHQQGAVFFTDAQAAALAGHPGQVDAIGVTADPAVDAATLKARVQRVVDGIHADAVVLTGGQRGQAEFLDGTSGKTLITVVSGVFGGYVVWVTVFVVAAALGLAVSQRRRELALLRAVAATPRQVRRMLALEALAVALVGGAVGWLPGVAAAGWVRQALVDRAMVLDTFELHVSFIPPVAAIAIGVLATQVAGVIAARRATQIRPTAALQEAGVERQGPGWIRTILGLGSVAGAFAIFAVDLGQVGDNAINLALPMLMLFLLGVALLGPLVARAITTVVGVPLRWLSPVTGFLAAANTKANGRRLASAITPLVLTIAFGATLVFMQLTMLHGADGQVADGLVADRVVRTTPAGVPRPLVARIRSVPGVAVAMPTVDSTVVVTGQPPSTPDMDRETYAARGVDPRSLADVIDLDVDGGRIADLGPDRIALSQTLSRLLHRRVGDRVWVTLGDRTVRTMTVVATYRRGLGYGDATLAYDQLAAHVTDRLDHAVLVRRAAGADPRAVDRGLRAVTATVPGTTIADHDRFASDARRDEADGAWLNDLLVVVLVGFVAVGVVNTMVMATRHRARELTLLGLVGATRGQARRMLAWEAVIVAVAGLLLGGGIAAAALVPITRGLVGTSMPYIPILGYGATIAGAFALCLPAVLLAARRPS